MSSLPSDRALQFVATDHLERVAASVTTSPEDRQRAGQEFERRREHPDHRNNAS